MDERFVAIRHSTNESDPGSGTGGRLVPRLRARHGRDQPPTFGSPLAASLTPCAVCSTASPAPLTVSVPWLTTRFAGTDGSTAGTLTAGRLGVCATPPPAVGAETPSVGDGGDPVGPTAAGAVEAVSRVAPERGAPATRGCLTVLGAPRAALRRPAARLVVLARVRAGRGPAATGRARAWLVPVMTVAAWAAAWRAASWAPPPCGATPAPTPATITVAATATALDQPAASGSETGASCVLPPHMRARRKPGSGSRPATRSATRRPTGLRARTAAATPAATAWRRHG